MFIRCLQGNSKETLDLYLAEVIQRLTEKNLGSKIGANTAKTLIQLKFWHPGNYLHLKNRVMCLKNSGGVWGGCLPNLGGHGGKAWKLAERSTQQDNSSEPTDPLNNVPLISLRQMRQKNLRKDFGILWLLGELATRPIEMIKVCNKKALSRRGERLQHSGA